MSRITDVLLSIDFAVWALNLATLAALHYKDKREQSLSSSQISMFVMVVLGGVMTAYSPYLHYLYSQDNSIERALIAAWHIGFMGWDIIGILWIYIWHRLRSLPYSTLSAYVTLSYYAMGNLQLIRFNERYRFDSDYLSGVYSYGIAGVNYAITIMAVVIAAMALRGKYKLEMSINGWKPFQWTI